jgi:hypothetical protein
MQIFPTTRAAKLRFGIILLVGLSALGYLALYPLARLALYSPTDGDIVFQSLPHMDLVDAIEGVTLSPFSHCGVVMRRTNHWVVVEAIGDVHETSLWQWVLRGRRGRFEAYRLRDTTQMNSPRLQEALTTFMGRPYDFHYDVGDEEIYCSELVYKAYDRGLGLQVGKMERLGDLNWKPFETFIRSMEDGKLPLDRQMISPVGLTRSPLVRRVFPKGA